MFGSTYICLSMCCVQIVHVCVSGVCVHVECVGVRKVRKVVKACDYGLLLSGPGKLREKLPVLNVAHYFSVLAKGVVQATRASGLLQKKRERGREREKKSGRGRGREREKKRE